MVESNGMDVGDDGMDVDMSAGGAQRGPLHSVFVQGIVPHSDEKSVKQLFFGKNKGRVIKWSYRAENGSAIVSFAEESEAKNVLAQNGALSLFGVPLRITEYKSKGEREKHKAGNVTHPTNTQLAQILPLQPSFQPSLQSPPAVFPVGFQEPQLVQQQQFQQQLLFSQQQQFQQQQQQQQQQQLQFQLQQQQQQLALQQQQQQPQGPSWFSTSQFLPNSATAMGEEVPAGGKKQFSKKVMATINAAARAAALKESTVAVMDMEEAAVGEGVGGGKLRVVVKKTTGNNPAHSSKQQQQNMDSHLSQSQPSPQEARPSRPPKVQAKPVNVAAKMSGSHVVDSSKNGEDNNSKQFNSSGGVSSLGGMQKSKKFSQPSSVPPPPADLGQQPNKKLNSGELRAERAKAAREMLNKYKVTTHVAPQASVKVTKKGGVSPTAPPILSSSVEVVPLAQSQQKESFVKDGRGEEKEEEEEEEEEWDDDAEETEEEEGDEGGYSGEEEGDEEHESEVEGEGEEGVPVDLDDEGRGVSAEIHPPAHPSSSTSTGDELAPTNSYFSLEGATLEIKVGLCDNMCDSKTMADRIALMRESKRGVPPPGFDNPLPGAPPFPEGTMIKKFSRLVG